MDEAPAEMVVIDFKDLVVQGKKGKWVFDDCISDAGMARERLRHRERGFDCGVAAAELEFSSNGATEGNLRDTSEGSRWGTSFPTQ